MDGFNLGAMHGANCNIAKTSSPLLLMLKTSIIDCFINHRLILSRIEEVKESLRSKSPEGRMLRWINSKWTRFDPWTLQHSNTYRETRNRKRITQPTRKSSTFDLQLYKIERVQYFWIWRVNQHDNYVSKGIALFCMVLHFVVLYSTHCVAPCSALLITIGVNDMHFLAYRIR